MLSCICNHIPEQQANSITSWPISLTSNSTTNRSLLEFTNMKGKIALEEAFTLPSEEEKQKWVRGVDLLFDETMQHQTRSIH